MYLTGCSKSDLTYPPLSYPCLPIPPHAGALMLLCFVSAITNKKQTDWVWWDDGRGPDERGANARNAQPRFRRSRYELAGHVRELPVSVFMSSVYLHTTCAMHIPWYVPLSLILPRPRKASIA